MYVQRNDHGAVTGVSSYPHPDFSEKPLADDHPDVVAFLNPPEPIPQSITARKLRIGLVLAEWITEAEAVAWRKGEALPAPVQAVIDAMPAGQRFIAAETAFSMSVAERDNPLLIAAAQAAMPDATEQEISGALDQAFRDWSAL